MSVINGHFKKGTAANYAAMKAAGTLDRNTFYYVDEEALYLGEILLSDSAEQAQVMASNVTLADNQNIFSSTNVEDAMAEIAGMIPGEISVVTDSNVADVLKRYTFYKGEQIAANKLIDIDIPKDLMSVSGTVVSQDGEGNEGTFIKLNIGTSASDEKSAIYVDVAALVTGMSAGSIVYKPAVAADPENGIEAQEEVTVEEALDDIYSKIENVSPSTFIWEELTLDPVGILNITAYTGDEDLFGKTASDLQEDIVIGENAITGTLKYVADYSGFSSDPTLTSGNYIVLHAEVPDATGVTITATVTNPSTLDSDGIVVLRIADKDTQTITFTASKAGYATVTKTFTLSGLEVANA